MSHSFCDRNLYCSISISGTQSNVCTMPGTQKVCNKCLNGANKITVLSLCMFYLFMQIGLFPSNLDKQIDLIVSLVWAYRQVDQLVDLIDGNGHVSTKINDALQE